MKARSWSLGVEIDGIVRPMPGNMVIQNVFDELRMGIDDGHAVAGGDIARDDVAQKRALAGTGAAEEREVAPSGVRLKINTPAFMEGLFAADEDRMERHGQGK